MSDEEPKAATRSWAPPGLAAAPDQDAAANAQLETLTPSTAACGTKEVLPEREWPLKRSDLENPASSWVALVVAFDGGDPEEISELIRLAKSSLWTWRALDKNFSAAFPESAEDTVPATQPFTVDLDAGSSNDDDDALLLDVAILRDLQDQASPL